MISTSLGLTLLLQGAAPASGGGGSLAPLAFQIGAIILIFYVFMWLPQKKQRKKHEEALRGLKRGDEIVTSGGIVGKVIHIRETAKDGGANRMDDRVTIESGESRLIIERGRIARVIGASSAAADKAAASSTT